jgi:urease accessory protein
VRAQARLEVARDGDGTDRCVVLRSTPPLTLRRTPGEVQLVGSAAGPLGGDELALDVQVHAGASLVLRSVAAMMALPGISGEPSRLDLDVRVARDGALVWNPQPTIAVAGCDHHTVTRLSLEAGADLLWRDELVLGRFDERSGSVRQRLDVDVDGLPLLRTEVVAGPRYPGSEGPGGAAGARALGSLLVAGPIVAQLPRPPPGPRAPFLDVRLEVLALAGPGVLVSALAPNPGAVTRALDVLVAAWQPLLGPGTRPHDRRAGHAVGSKQPRMLSPGCDRPTGPG